MNPFLERSWGSVHTALIGFIWEGLGPQLPRDLVVRPEERVMIDQISSAGGLRPVVTVSETWTRGVPPRWNPGEAGAGRTVAEPQVIWMEETLERWLEIRTADGALVTAIKVLSPSNRSGPGREVYLAKQRTYLESLASLVEIDLLRAGHPTLGAPMARVQERAPGTCYHVCVSRASSPHLREVYSCPLREPLPAFRVPLRPTDPDAVLDLQPLIDRCYVAGRYDLSPHDQNPEPPFPEDEAAWVNEQVQAAGLR